MLVSWTFSCNWSKYQHAGYKKMNLSTRIDVKDQIKKNKNWNSHNFINENNKNCKQLICPMDLCDKKPNI